MKKSTLLVLSMLSFLPGPATIAAALDETTTIRLFVNTDEPNSLLARYCVPLGGPLGQSVCKHVLGISISVQTSAHISVPYQTTGQYKFYLNQHECASVGAANHFINVTARKSEEPPYEVTCELTTK